MIKKRTTFMTKNKKARAIINGIRILLKNPPIPESKLCKEPVVDASDICGNREVTSKRK